MFFTSRKFLFARLTLILALLGGLFGTAPIQIVHAATLIVTNTSDNDPGSLRQAIANAGSGDTITFDPSLTGQTITLASNLVINKDLTIDGSGLSPQVTISGGNVAYLRVAPAYVTATISNLTITDGYGRGIESTGNLTILNSTLKNNYGLGSGAAIYSSGALTIKNSTITQNQSQNGGGAIYIGGAGDNLISNSTITNNAGGIVTGGNATVQIINSTFAANSASSSWSEILVNGQNFLLVTNSIFVCTQSNNCYDYGVAQIDGNSILGVGTLADYGLTELADNGGPTQTMALLPESPLIDAGDDSVCANSFVNNLDQRGVSRPQAAHCDIGAYEYEPESTIHYVKWNATGTNNGTSWANAYTDLQSALSVASSGDEIWVAAGTYKPTAGADRTISFTLKNGVEIHGGFAGTETMLGERNLDANLTILSGDIGGVGDNSDNSFHVVVGSGTNNSAILDGFTVSDGKTNVWQVSPMEYNGAGMYNLNGDPTVKNVIFTNNEATIGGGMYNGGESGQPESGSHPILENVVFENNLALIGGGMSNENYSSPRLTNVLFHANIGTHSGGGMDNSWYCDPILKDVAFDANIAGVGGGMATVMGNPELTNVTFSNNSAEWGGAMANGYSSPKITNATFYGNSATTYGGGISNESFSNPVLKHITFRGNTAVTLGGAIYNDSLNSNVNIQNSILYGDTAGGLGDEIYTAAETANVAASIVQRGYPGTGNLDIDPLLGPLKDNGGFTQTMALGADSAAIDAANDSNCPSTDQRGVTRPQGSACDIGAYEGVTNLTVNEVVDIDDGICDSDCSLREAIATVSEGGTIKFDPSLSGQTITLASPLYIDKDLTVDGSTLSTHVKIDSHDPSFQEGLNIGYFNNVNVNLSEIDFVNASLNSILEYGGTLTVQNCNFSGNVFSIHVFEGNLVVQDSTFSDNGTLGFASGIYNEYGAVTITHSNFDHNGGEYGGAIYNSQNGTLTVQQSIFSSNMAHFGGGIMNSSLSAVSVSNSLFINNTATERGGGIYNSGYLILTGSTFSENNAGDNGGGVSNFFGAMDVTGNTFSNNFAANYGGGLSVIDSELQMTNSTFSNNSASQGGDIYFDRQRPSILKSNTITGGGLYINDGNLQLFNNILANSLTGFDCFAGSTAVLTGSQNLIENDSISPNSCGIASITADPLLQPLADNGGFTPTLALGADSPAINAGDDTNCPATDQRGIARPRGSHCDIGSYEFEAEDIEVRIGDTGVGSYFLVPGESTRKSFTDVNSGPVKIINADNDLLIAAERVIYKVNNLPTSFSEMMALPESQLDNTYWMPWYNNVDLDTQLRFGNVSNTPAEVHVWIGGLEKTSGCTSTPANVPYPYVLAVGASLRLSCPGVNNGPVKIVSNVNIVAAERVIYNVNGLPTSFTEMMGLPDSQLNTTYWMPWYNNVDLDTQLRFGNVSDTPATVRVWIGGQEKTSGCTTTPANVPYPYVLAVGASLRVSCPGLNNGPVQIVSNVNIVAAERVIYNVNGMPTSFTEMMGLPDSQLDNTYWMPWYNNVDLDTQLRFGNVSNTPATVRVWIGGQEKTSGCTTTPANVPYPYVLAVGASLRVSCPGLNSGPVQIVSDVNIVAAERVIYNVNNLPTSFTEMMGLPNSQLNTTYLMPWYNNVDLDTQLRFGVP